MKTEKEIKKALKKNEPMLSRNFDSRYSKGFEYHLGVHQTLIWVLGKEKKAAKA